AERQKRDASSAKEAKKLYQATEVVLKDFVGQIQQSIGFYKKLNKERTVQIAQVLLLGSGSKLANIRPFFQKELGYPVETVKRLTAETDVEPIDKQVKPLAAVARSRTLMVELLNQLAGVRPKGNAELTGIDEAQRKVLTNEGTKVAKVQKLKEDLDAAQAKL